MGRHSACAERAVNVQSIDEVPILVAAASDLRVRLQERLRPADVNLGHDDARDHAGDRPHVCSIRQDLEDVRRQHGLVQRSRRIQQGRFRRHDNALLDCANLQLQVHTRRDVGVHRNVALLGGAESLHVRSDVVDARDKPQELK